MQSANRSVKAGNIFLRILPLHKIIISAFLSFLTYLLLRNTSYNWKMHVLILWIVFAIPYLTLSWLLFLTCPASKMKEHAGKEDGSRAVVMLLILISSLFGMIAVLMLIITGKSSGTPQIIFLSVVIISMFLSWCMVHTTYCFHYAHLYYNTGKSPVRKEGGLEFPGGEIPDYFDFAYYSFVVGMTFQVSDVQITSKKIRRLTLQHGLLSFGLNTIVVALAFNLIAGLMK